MFVAFEIFVAKVDKKTHNSNTVTKEAFYFITK